jgi:glutamate decarboxylase
LQYYNFLRLGREGYRRVQQACKDAGRHLAAELTKMEPFEMLNDGSDMPLVTWTLKDGYTDRWDLHDLSAKLRERGWQVPAYPMPADIEDMTVMRVVVRNGVSMDLIDLLLDDMRSAVAFFDQLSGPMPKEETGKAGFHH